MTAPGTQLSSEASPHDNDLAPRAWGLDRYKFGWADSDTAGASARGGLSKEVVRDIFGQEERAGMDARPAAEGAKLFGRKPIPDWGADLTGIHFDNIK
jgi:Fe-S cluster assembly protein SufB